MEASSHLVPDNCLLRPAPFVSHINLDWGLVCLGSKLSETYMVSRGMPKRAAPAAQGTHLALGPHTYTTSSPQPQWQDS